MLRKIIHYESWCQIAQQGVLKDYRYSSWNLSEKKPNMKALRSQEFDILSIKEEWNSGEN